MDTFWAAFLPQLIATLVGGLLSVAVALVGVERGFRLQRTAERDDAARVVAAERNERAQAAASSLMVELARYADSLEASVAWGKFGAVRGTPPPPPASRNAVSIAVEVLVMATQDEDRAVARRISDAWSVVRSAKGDPIGGVGVLAGAIAAWRTGDKEGSALRSHIKLAEELARDGMFDEDDESSEG